MFVFGTDGDTQRAWPLHTILSIAYHAKGRPKSGGRPELAVQLTNGTVVWLKGDEADAVWEKIVAHGYGQSPLKP